jgi:hypothetical protein
MGIIVGSVVEGVTVVGTRRVTALTWAALAQAARAPWELGESRGFLHEEPGVEE